MSRKLKSLARAKHWIELFRVAKKGENKIDYSACLSYQLQAALGLSDEAKIKACCIKIKKIGNIDQSIKTATILLKYERPLEAAGIIAGLPRDQRTGQAANLAKRIEKTTKDRTTRRKVRNLLYRKVPSRETLSKTIKHRFPRDSDEFSVPASRIEVIRIAGVEPEIEEHAKLLFSRFEAALKKENFPVVTEYQDVFVNDRGMIWSADGSVYQSLMGVVPAVTDPTSVPNFDEAFGCTGQQKGYFEWIVRRLSALAWRLDPTTPDCPILLRQQHLNLAKDALCALGVHEDKLIAIEGPVFCRRLYVGDATISMLPRTSVFQPTYGGLIAAAERRNNSESPRRFYISRRDSTRRSMTNEADFERALSERGITPIVLSELGLLEKINLFRNAELVIGAHGAGLSHLIFAKPGMRVIEIMPTSLAKSVMLGVQTCFTRLSAVYGHHHTFVLQPMDPATSEWSPNIADIDRVLAAG
ncbi:glycosyltransferase family 61 protein [Methylobacterium bullatum]|uniref:Glycosyltransferase 61 catalytic domain-containing protein n=1 Tax=Methylobacterium bullatum TaxID=570505 RepID=A0A679KB90_9HYPH|nr:hypothetical protein MBLL_04503 [Methylobacterium bullatum]